MCKLNYTPRTLGARSWREIISGGTRTKKLNITRLEHTSSDASRSDDALDKDLDGSGRGPLKEISGHLHGGTEENHGKPQLGYRRLARDSGRAPPSLQRHRYAKPLSKYE